MSALVSSQHLEVPVEYAKFGIQESDDLAIPDPFPNGATSGPFLEQFPMRLDLGSAGHTHRAALRVEVWDGEPDPDAQTEWEATAEASIETISGDLAVWSMARLHPVISLGRAGVWRVRVVSSGRNEVARVTSNVGVAHGVERWLLQFWPEAS